MSGKKKEEVVCSLSASVVRSIESAAKTQIRVRRMRMAVGLDEAEEVQLARRSSAELIRKYSPCDEYCEEYASEKYMCQMHKWLQITEHAERGRCVMESKQ